MGLIILILIAGVVFFIFRSRKNKASERCHRSLSEHKEITDSNLGKMPRISSLDEEKYEEHSQKIQLHESNESKSLSQAINTKDYSLKGNHYRKLRQFLENSQWEEANEETKHLLKAFAYPGDLPNWTIREIHETPIEVINNIDYLWGKFSHGKLGFSVQKRILESTPAYDYYLFADKIGWYSQKEQAWKFDFLEDGFLFSNLEGIPEGYLPAILGIHMYGIHAQMSSGMHSFTSSRIKPFFYFMDRLLSTAKGIDYSHLRNLLAEEKWEEADQETAEKIDELVQASVGDGSSLVVQLDEQSIFLLPQKDIETIDNLWHQYSKGKFSFGVQKRIFLEEKGDKVKYLDRVGWSYDAQKLIALLGNLILEKPYGFFPLSVWLLGKEENPSNATLDLEALFIFLENSNTPIDNSLELSDELDSLPKISLMLQMSKRKQRVAESLETMLEESDYSSKLCQEAIDSLEEMNSIWPKNPQILMQLSSIYLFCGKVEETEDPEKIGTDYFGKALSCIEGAIRIDPDFEESWEIKGDVYLSLRSEFGGYEFEQAVQCFDKAISINPQPYHWFKKGVASYYQKNHESAIECFKQALILSPSDDYVCFWQGHASFMRSEQIKILSDMYDQDLCIPFLENAVNACQKALENCRTPIQLKPKKINYWITLGKALAGLERVPEAIEAYDIANRLNDYKKIPLYEKGELLLKIGNYQGGLLCFDEVIKRFNVLPQPDDDLWGLLGVLYGKAVCHLNLLEEDPEFHLEGILTCLMGDEDCREWIRDEKRFFVIRDMPRFREFLKENHLESWWFDT